MHHTLFEVGPNECPRSINLVDTLDEEGKSSSAHLRQAEVSGRCVCAETFQLVRRSTPLLILWA